ncbi:YrhC family protein [Aeribacillus pallidus]|uniref:YrhC family protein n=1 Tax=Aeribacillus pallidus TaxID=33936 RepID=UPI003D197C76
METKVKQLKEKMIDFQRFGYILLALSVFLYLGVVIPMEGKTTGDDIWLMSGTFLIISLAGCCFNYSLKCKKQLQHLEE